MVDEKLKIDNKKMEEATKALREILVAVEKYNGLFKNFTPQEKRLAGGIVFRIRNIWDDFSMVGVMADRELAGDMINTLALFFQHPEQFKGVQDNTIEVVDAKPKDDLSN